MVDPLLCRVCEEEEAVIDGLCEVCFDIRETVREDEEADDEHDTHPF